MDTLECIAEKLKESEKVLIYTHIHMDGDALGSAAALCSILRRLGKKSFIHIEDNIAENLKFLDRGYCVTYPEIKADTSICVDCSGEDRIPKRYESYKSADVTLCIDHHRTGSDFADFNYIDPEAAATGEIIFDLSEILGVSLNKEEAEALYAAINTDTGKFQYSNTTRKTHEIVTKLYESGIDHSYVCNEIYENNTYESLKLEVLVMNTLERFADGKGVIAYITQDMLKKTGTTMDEADGFVAKLRAIKGVEIAALLKEKDKEDIKVSMRAKTFGNVAVIGSEFGGGGHIKAAGCTLSMTVEEASRIIKERITRQLVK